MMIKANADYIEVEPECYQYLSDGKVRAVLKTRAGDRISYVMSMGSFFRSVDLATRAMNENLSASLNAISGDNIAERVAVL
ncbi:hypothetical protein AB7008_43090 [Bradyrhizobium sp. 521_C7_N1_3]|uniref:hypothetical protein n=1 Tax=Bradyrhizobium sp. 521_C7_N1_3 TaxID=3240368 RepID=UPI003F8BE264